MLQEELYSTFTSQYEGDASEEEIPEETSEETPSDEEMPSEEGLEDEEV